jgi:hypothetical protein
MNDAFNAITGFTTFQGNLMACTDLFDISSWDGSSWQEFPALPNHVVAKLNAYNGELIVGGYFTAMNFASANRIARWNGNVWLPLSSGLDGNISHAPRVDALAAYNGDLIVGGVFQTAGGQPASAIARWNGAAWQAIGAGVSSGSIPQVASIVVYKDELVIGGNFLTAGGKPANRIARWRDCDLCIADIVDDNEVNVDDLLAIINAWGDCPEQPIWCGEDLAPLGGDGVINADDLVKVINNWNGCCAGDASHDGITNVDDLLAVINAWGECSPNPSPPPMPVCPADISHNGKVDVEDLLMVVNAWGPCG